MNLFGKPSRPYLLLILILAAALSAGAQTASRVREFPLAPGSAPANGEQLTPLGNRVLYVVRSPGQRLGQLWASDGTSLGTKVLAGDVSDIAGTLNGRLYFPRREAAGFRLYRTDGTPAGTIAITPPGVRLEPFDEPVFPRVLGNRLYFTGCTEAQGCEPWVSDGTPEGTHLVEEITPGTVESFDYPTGYFLFRGQVLFFLEGTLLRIDGESHIRGAFSTFAGYVSNVAILGDRLIVKVDEDDELWSTDLENPRLLLEYGSLDGKSIDLLGAIGDHVYFYYDDGVHGDEIWRTDGTVQGTARVTDLPAPEPFGGESGFRTVFGLAERAGRLLFIAGDGSPRQRLWTTTGAPASTAPLCVGATCPQLPDGRWEELGERLFFTGFDPEHGREPWVTDGTPAGTRRLLDLCPGECPGLRETDGFSISKDLGGQAFFNAVRSLEGRGELWRTDGTTEGTARFGNAPVSPAPFLRAALSGSRLFFAAEGGNGRELWVTGAATGTARALSVLSGDGADSRLTQLQALGSRLLFAVDNFTGEEAQLWSGTESAAEPLLRAEGSCTVAAPVAGEERAWFWDPCRSELWQTDGTPAGTRSIASSPQDRPLLPLAALGRQVLYRTVSPHRLWIGDGIGFQPLAELPGSPVGAARLGSEVWFATESSSRIWEIWRTDGTPAGTRSLGTNLFPGVGPISDLSGFTRRGAEVFFYVHAESGSRLWKTDGTAAGTGSASSGLAEPTPLAFAGGELYFFEGSLPEEGPRRRLWRTGGAGLQLLRTWNDPGFSWPDTLVAFGGKVYFIAFEPGQGEEIWQSDGTPEGTRPAFDLAPGAESSAPRHLTAAGGLLFFSAFDAAHGRELWRSDGTPGGTRRVQDLAPGPLSADPMELTAAEGFLYFAAGDGRPGTSLWALPLAPAGCQPSATRLCLSGGRFQVESTWQDFSGNSGTGQAVALSGDTGYFWFFDPANVELVTKVLDAEALNQHFWVFYGALSSVEYTLTVTDTRTGASRRYTNPSGSLASVGDTQAFGPLGAFAHTPLPSLPALVSERSDPAATAPCVAGPRRLCLNGGRFAVEARWKDFQNRTGAGTGVGLTGDTGYFWFFDPANVEVVLKVLDGRGLNGKFWVFFGALSNVEYTLTVSDTQTGAVRTYANPSGRFASVADTGAF